MNTVVLNKNQLKEVKEIIRDAGLVAFPTDTVYGLGADARSDQAVKKIFAAKKRSFDRPLSVLVANKNINKYVKDISTDAKKLMDKFWPGPLTIILQKSDYFSSWVTAGENTIGLRMPDNELTLKLISVCGTPLATPSANTSGRPSPTTAQHVLNDLEGKIEAVIDDGPTSTGIESTVIDLSVRNRPLILRQGDISKEDIERILNCRIAIAENNQTPHYNPLVPVYTVTSSWDKAIKKMSNKKIGLLATDETLEQLKENKSIYFSLGKVDNPKQVKKNFYKGLLFLEEKDIDVILVESFATRDFAVYMNRLEKAANYKVI